MTKITKDRDIFLSKNGKIFLTEEDCLKAEKHDKKLDCFAAIVFGIFLILMVPQFVDLYENGFPKVYKIEEVK